MEQKELDPILSHLKVMLDTNVPKEQLACLCRIFKVTPKINQLDLGLKLEKHLTYKKVKGTTTSEEINELCDYLSESFIDGIEQDEITPVEELQLRHSWKEECIPFRGSNNVDVLLYNDQDKFDFIYAIRNMMPGFIPPHSYHQPKAYKAESNQLTFMLPYNNEFDGDHIISKGKGWDIYNLDDVTTKELLETTEGAMAFLTALQLLGLNEPPIDSLLAQADLVDDFSPIIQYRKVALEEITLLREKIKKGSIPLKTQIEKEIEAVINKALKNENLLKVLPVSRDIKQLTKIHESLLTYANYYPENNILKAFISNIEYAFKPFVTLSNSSKDKKIKTFSKLSQLFESDELPGYAITGESAGKEDEFIIPRLKSKNNAFKELSYICSLKPQGNDEKLVAEDIVQIRKTLSYLMSHTSGVAITLNIPFANKTMRAKKMSNPTIIMPHMWAATINALRDSTTKNEKKEDCSALSTQELNIPNNKEQYANIINEFSLLFGLKKEDVGESAQMENNTKYSDEKFKSVGNKVKQKQALTKLVTGFLTVNGERKWIKSEVTPRLFPDPR